MSREGTQLSPGQVLQGRYRIEAAIGRGGFAEVYRASQLHDGRAVAVKLLSPVFEPRDVDVRRFEREMALVRQIEHPNVVRLLGSGHGPAGLPFAAFELVSGGSLADRIDEQGAVPLHHVAAIAAHVLEGLAAAHRLGMVHRDLKPDNILLEPVGPTTVVARIIDFGLAKALWGDESQRTKLTAAGMVVGTPQYMAPEQARGEPVAAAADLYSLGLVLAEAVTGQPVVAADVPSQAMLAQLAAAPLPLPEAVLRSPLGSVIQRAVQKSLAHRTRSAEEMLAELRAAHDSAAAGVPAPGAIPLAHAPTAPIDLGAGPTAPVAIGVGPTAPVDLGFAPTAPPDTAHAPTALPGRSAVALADTALPDPSGVAHGRSAVEQVFGQAASSPPAASPSAPSHGPGPSAPAAPAAAIELELLPLEEEPAPATPPPSRRGWLIVLAIAAVLLIGAGSAAILLGWSDGWGESTDSAGAPFEGFDDEEQADDEADDVDLDDEEMIADVLVAAGAKKMPGLAALDHDDLLALLKEAGCSGGYELKIDPPREQFSQLRVVTSKGGNEVTAYLRRYGTIEMLASAVAMHLGRGDAVAVDKTTTLVILKTAELTAPNQLLTALIAALD